MEITADFSTQLGIAIVLGLALFSAAYVVSERTIVAILVVLIPFQFIDSRFGSLNMVATYLAFLAIYLQGKITRWPLLKFVAFILVAYLLSLAQAPRATWLDHSVYLLSFGSNVLLFYLTYNFFFRSGDTRLALKIFAWMSLLAIVYCIVQLTVGIDRFVLFGVEELAFGQNTDRLLGPFGSAGVTANFLGMQALILAYASLYARTPLRRNVLLLLMAACFAFVVATGSRGSFLTTVGGVVLFLWFFRPEIGAQRTMRFAIAGGSLLVLSAVLIVSFSDFNILFERLGATQIEGGVAESRAGTFDAAIERFPDSPVLGHGPRLRLFDDLRRRIPGHIPIGYPHNLFFFLVHTVGLLGLLAYLAFFWSLGRAFHRSRQSKSRSPVLNGVPTLALILLIVFLVDEYKIEFLRFGFRDLQQYMFASWGLMLGLSHRLRVEAGREVASERADAHRSETVPA